MTTIDLNLQAMIESSLAELEQEGIVEVIYSYTPDDNGKRWRILYGTYRSELTLTTSEQDYAFLWGMQEGLAWQRR